MRVMLIFPPNIDVIKPFKSAKRKPPALVWGFPLGLGYLAAVLKQAGYDVSIFDAGIDNISIEGVISEIKKYQPDLVGIATMTLILRTAVACAKRIKQFNKDIKIVFGGPHATFDYENLLSLGFIDYIVRGEGEYTFLELCEKLKRNEPVGEIRGIAFRDNDDKVKKTAFRPLIENLDSLPFPARELIDFKRYIRNFGVLEKRIDVVSSRGCSNVCAFCSSAHMFGRWRPRSPENIIMEIKTLIKKFPEIKSINFMDDDFTVNKERVLKLCNLLINNGLNKYIWTCLARVDRLDEEMVWAMKDAGCVRVHLGIESGSPQILKNLNKRISLNQASKAVNLLTMAKIETLSFFLVGSPGETNETIKLTKKFARKLKSSVTLFNVTQILPGTKLERLQPVNNWLKYIYEPEIDNPSMFTHPCIPNFIPKGFTREVLKKICASISKQFVFLDSLRRLPRSLKKFITEPKSTIKYILRVLFP